MHAPNDILTLYNFDRLLNDKTLVLDAKNFYSEEKVKKTTLIEPGLVLGSVLSETGLRCFSVKVLFNHQVNEKEIVDFHCTCVQMREKNGEEICKHIVATLFFLRMNGLPEMETQEESMRKRRAERRSLTLVRSESEKYNKIPSEAKAHDHSTTPKQNCPTEVNPLEKEAECQVCLEFLERPVFSPCFVHSICYCCMDAIFQKKASLRKNLEDEVKVDCPTCGSRGGFKMVRSMEDFLENKELDRILLSYKEEKKKFDSLNLRKSLSEGSSSVDDTLHQIEELINSLPSSDTDKITQFVWDKLVSHNTDIKLELLSKCRVIQYKPQLTQANVGGKVPLTRIKSRRSLIKHENALPVQKKRKQF